MVVLLSLNLHKQVANIHFVQEFFLKLKISAYIENFYNNNNPYKIPRFAIQNWNLNEFQKAIETQFNFNDIYDLIKNYFNYKWKKGFEYAYRNIGIIKVIQAAGRIFRSNTDKGIIILIGAVLIMEFISSSISIFLPLFINTHCFHSLS